MITRDVGDRVSIRYLARDTNGNLTDTTMALLVTAPDNSTSNPSITHTSTGTYDAFFDLSQPGMWEWKWTASVTIVDVAYGYVNAAAAPTLLYVTLEEFKDELQIPTSDTTKDNVILSKLRSAQSQVDGDCGRSFGKDTSASQRIFEAHQLELLAVDDIADLTGLIVETGFNTTWSTLSSASYVCITGDSLQPIVKGWPVEYIKRTQGSWYVHGAVTNVAWRGAWPQQVRVTAIWGWPAVPEDIKNATILRASRLLRRKDSPEGVRGFADLGVVRVGRYDPDYDSLIGNYVKDEV